MLKHLGNKTRGKKFRKRLEIIEDTVEKCPGTDVNNFFQQKIVKLLNLAR